MEKKSCVIDIESSGLLSNMLDYSSLPYKLKEDAKMWCICVLDIQTNVVHKLVGDDITKENLGKILSEYYYIIAHNGIKFDFPTLMLFGLIDYNIGYLNEPDTLNGKEVKFVDTLIMSRFINPDRVGGHSLGSWGDRVGVPKTDYRGELISLGVIEKYLSKGEEFKFFHPLMVDYCSQDVITNGHTYIELLKEYKGYTTAKQGLQVEHKLADLAVSRENLGFWFDKELALKNLEFLEGKMAEIANVVNPLLPKKKLTQTALSNFTPPVNQLKKDGTWSSHMVRFFEKHGITEFDETDKWFTYKGNIYEVPYLGSLEYDEEATIDDLDVVKHSLLKIRSVKKEYEHLYTDIEWKDE